LRWSEIPPAARRYILYHTAVSPLLIVWYMLPAYMLMTGMSVLEAGALFTAVNALSIPLTYLIGRAFDRIAIRSGLVAVEVLGGLSSVLYGLSYFVLGSAMLVLGMVIDRLSRILYPLYQAAEKVLYPSDRMEEVLSWHMRLPLLSEALGFVALGYVFGAVFTGAKHFALGFIAIGAASFLLALYIAKALPRMGVAERISEGFTFRIDREFRAILLLEVLDTLIIYLAPEIVLINYLMFTLGMSFFEVMTVVALSILASIPATYLSERIDPRHRFKVIATYFMLRAIWASIMFFIPSFAAILVANIVAEFGNTLSLPFYRSWVFSKIPREKASSILASIASLDRVVGIVSPLIATALASIHASLPYLACLALTAIATALTLHLEQATRTNT